jgi:DivIVA domain-containing protein
MELTPQQLFDVEFSEQWRGYNRDQVDDFIERVAAGVAALQERLRAMTERAVRAEQRAQSGDQSGGGARRTLVLAQRTADATVAEARQTAASIVAQAQEEARAILMTTSDTDAPAASPEPASDIADLRVTKSRLEADVAALERHVADRRGRIRDLLGELQRRVDEGLGHSLEDPVPLWPGGGPPGAADLAPVEDVEWAEDDREWEQTPVPPTSAFEFQQDLAAPVSPPPPDLPIATAEPPPPPPEPVPPAPEPAPEPEPEPAPEPAPEEWVTAEAGAADDNFFAQLRGALDDDAPLGPRDDDPYADPLWGEDEVPVDRGRPTLYDQERTEGRKFGLRLRRQRRHA